MHAALSMTSSCSYIRKSFYILSARGEYDNALAFIDSISRITPCEPTCDMMRFYLYTTQRKFDKAEMCLSKAIKAGYKLEWDDYLYKSCLFKETGKRIEDLSIIRSIAAREESILLTGKSFWASETALRAAAGYAVLGDEKKAIGFIRMLEKYGCNDNPFPLMTFPGFNNLKNNPEFLAIVKRIEDNRAALREKVREMEQRREINL
jgi:tetratricopeptide (TPR) repeat protein